METFRVEVYRTMGEKQQQSPDMPGTDVPYEGFPYPFTFSLVPGRELKFLADEKAVESGLARIFDGRIVSLIGDRNSLHVSGILDDPDQYAETAGAAICPEMEGEEGQVVRLSAELEAVALPQAVEDFIGADAIAPQFGFGNTERIEGANITDLGFAQVRDGWKMVGIVIGKAKVPAEKFGEVEEEILDDAGNRVRDPQNPGKWLTRKLQEVFLVQGEIQVEVLNERTRRYNYVAMFGTVKIRAYSRLEGPLDNVLKKQAEAQLQSIRTSGRRMWLPVEIECLGRGRDKEGDDGEKKRTGSAYFAVRYRKPVTTAK